MLPTRSPLIYLWSGEEGRSSLPTTLHLAQGAGLIPGPRAWESWLSIWPSKTPLWQGVGGAYLFFFSFLIFLAMLHGMWDLSSLTGDRTCVPYSGSAEP